MTRQLLQFDVWSNSQCGQDRFVHAVLGKRHGFFAEIGMSHPVELNNTYALEQLGWHGFMVDNDVGCVAALAKSPRTSPFILADSTKLVWDAATIPYFGEMLDYLSLDVDSATLATLLRIPLDKIAFRVMTVEHDAYRFGNAPRNQMREFLMRAGYILVCSDVVNEGVQFEDWWVHPSVNPESYARFISIGQPWEKIMEKI